MPDEATPPTPPKKPARKGKPPETPADPFAKAPTVKITGDYYFTDEEKRNLGMVLATLFTRKEEILAHKKDLMAQINAQAAGVEAELKGTSNKVRSGFEPREMEVFVLFHNPQKGQKSYYRTDNRGLVRSEMMLPSDYEQELPMPGLPPKEEKKAAPKPPNGSGKGSVPPGGDDGAGMTSLADALNAAAVGVDLKPVPFDVDPLDEPKVIARKFAKAAGAFGWPQAAIAILRDEVKKQEVAHRAIETLAPHIVAREQTADASAAE